MIRKILDSVRRMVARSLLRRLDKLEHSYLRLYELATTVVDLMPSTAKDDIEDLETIIFKFKIELSGIRVLMDKVEAMTFSTMHLLFNDIEEQLVLNQEKEKYFDSIIDELSNPKNISLLTAKSDTSDTWVH